VLLEPGGKKNFSQDKNSFPRVNPAETFYESDSRSSDTIKFSNYSFRSLIRVDLFPFAVSSQCILVSLIVLEIKYSIVNCQLLKLTN
jgi:hypothetical protein